MNNYDYFSVLVVGENPDEQMSKFDLMSDTDKPYIIYKHSDKSKIRKNKIKIYEELLKTKLSKKDEKTIKDNISKLKSLSDDEYYNELSELHLLDNDGNIVDTENPNGKWVTCEKGGRLYSSYIKDFNGNDVVSSTVGNVDWEFIHMNKDKVSIHERTWDLCVNNNPPETEKDRTILRNMSKFPKYFNIFKDKNQYVKFCCSFFTNAVVMSGNWVDMESFDDIVWVNNFYDTIIKPLNSKEIITIYECTK